MPRFALLVHDRPVLHWDLLLEQGDSCRTWRLRNSPDTEGDISVEPISNHRLVYLDYEGPLTGDRGTVSQWDAGTFEWVIDREDYCELRLAGRARVRMATIEGRTLRWHAE